MDKQLARSLLPIVNDFDNYQVLQLYANYRIDQLRKNLETANTIEEVKRYQGAIEEARRLLTLRDEVIEKAK